MRWRFGRILTRDAAVDRVKRFRAPIKPQFSVSSVKTNPKDDVCRVKAHNGVKLRIKRNLVLLPLDSRTVFRNLGARGAGYCCA